MTNTPSPWALARPTTPAHHLEREMRAVLLRLELVSHGKTAAINPNAVHGTGSTSPAPTGEVSPPHLIHRHRWNRCISDHGRRQVLKEAQTELERIQHAPVPTEPEWGSYWWKVKIANDGRSLEVVSRFYSIGKSTVSKYRARYRTEKQAA